MRNTFLLLLSVIFLFGSCTDEVIEVHEDDENDIENIEIDEENFQENSYKIFSCHNEQNWSIEELKETIVGEWEYVIGWCGWTGLIEPTFNKQTIKIEDDGTAIIKTDNDEESTTWSIAIDPNSNPHVVIESMGIFFVCGDKITTYTSPTDGCDLTFSK